MIQKRLLTTTSEQRKLHQGQNSSWHPVRKKNAAARRQVHLSGPPSGSSVELLFSSKSNRPTGYCWFFLTVNAVYCLCGNVRGRANKTPAPVGSTVHNVSLLKSPRIRRVLPREAPFVPSAALKQSCCTTSGINGAALFNKTQTKCEASLLHHYG